MAAAAEKTPWAGLHAVADVRRFIRTGMLLIGLFFGAFGLWAAIAPLSGALVASGVVKVDTNRKTIQHLEGGIVSEILVRDGDHVDAGQPLIVVQDERVIANLDLLGGQLDAERVRAARLAAERDGLDAIAFPQTITQRAGDPRIADLIRAEEVYFEARLTAMTETIALLTKEMGQAGEQIAALQHQVDGTDAAAGYLEEEIAANQEMEKKQYVQKIHILALNRAKEQYRVSRGEYLADMALARQKRTSLELQIADIRNARVKEAADQLIASTAVLKDLEERLRPARDATARQQILAPIAGTVVDLKVHTTGGVLSPRQPLLDIVPDDNPLIIEARVNVTDIDDLSPGQDADIRLSAYKMRTTPLVLGRVVYVAADRLTDEATGEPYYVAHIEVDQESLAAAPKLKLYPGMPAEVFIKTGTRTAIDYLLAPITQTLRRSLRES